MVWILAFLAVGALFALGLFGPWRSRRVSAWLGQQTARLERLAKRLPAPLEQFVQTTAKTLRGVGEVAARSGRQTRRKTKETLRDK